MQFMEREIGSLDKRLGRPVRIDDLRDGEEIAVCPSCSLMIRVIFDVEDLPKAEGEEKAEAA